MLAAYALNPVLNFPKPALWSHLPEGVAFYAIKEFSLYVRILVQFHPLPHMVTPPLAKESARELHRCKNSQCTQTSNSKQHFSRMGHPIPTLNEDESLQSVVDEGELRFPVHYVTFQNSQRV